MDITKKTILIFGCGSVGSVLASLFDPGKTRILLTGIFRMEKKALKKGYSEFIPWFGNFSDQNVFSVKTKVSPYFTEIKTGIADQMFIIPDLIVCSARIEGIPQFFDFLAGMDRKNSRLFTGSKKNIPVLFIQNGTGWEKSIVNHIFRNIKITVFRALILFNVQRKNGYFHQTTKGELILDKSFFNEWKNQFPASVKNGDGITKIRSVGSMEKLIYRKLWLNMTNGILTLLGLSLEEAFKNSGIANYIIFYLDDCRKILVLDKKVGNTKFSSLDPAILLAGFRLFGNIVKEKGKIGSRAEKKSVIKKKILYVRSYITLVIHFRTLCPKYLKKKFEKQLPSGMNSTYQSLVLNDSDPESRVLGKKESKWKLFLEGKSIPDTSLISTGLKLFIEAYDPDSEPERKTDRYYGIKGRHEFDFIISYFRDKFKYFSAMNQEQGGAISFHFPYEFYLNIYKIIHLLSEIKGMNKEDIEDLGFLQYMNIQKERI